ncbi:hypothetical protein BpHYR1_022914, partial [Brachionus plicatilis]
GKISMETVELLYNCPDIVLLNEIKIGLFGEVEIPKKITSSKYRAFNSLSENCRSSCKDSDSPIRRKNFLTPPKILAKPSLNNPISKFLYIDGYSSSIDKLIDFKVLNRQDMTYNYFPILWTTR